MKLHHRRNSTILLQGECRQYKPPQNYAYVDLIAYALSMVESIEEDGEPFFTALPL